MTTADGMQPVVVHVGPCRCIGRADAPPAHPDGDEVLLAPEAPLRLGLLANGALAAAGQDVALVEALLGKAFLDGGIVGWTFTEYDEPVPVTPANIERLLPWGHGGAEVSERANELYSEAILTPLARRWSTASRRGPTGGSTSAIRPSRQVRRRSSKSSSPARSETPT